MEYLPQTAGQQKARLNGIRASSDGPACNWWLRSVNAGNTNNFRNVNTSGSSNNNNANYSNGFAPGFKNNYVGQNK